MYEEALAINTRIRGVDNHFNADVLRNIAEAQKRSGNAAAALESATESCRIFGKLEASSDEALMAFMELAQLKAGAGEGREGA